MMQPLSHKLSRDDILKSDWHCQLSGNRSKQSELMEIARPFLLQQTAWEEGYFLSRYMYKLKASNILYTEL